MISIGAFFRYDYAADWSAIGSRFSRPDLANGTSRTGNEPMQIEIEYCGM
jgi:hypothetical protein